MISTIKVECNLQTLIRVLEATGNSTVAMEILDGTYVEPEISHAKVGRWETKRYNKVITNGLGEEETVEIEEEVPTVYHFVSYNPFTDEVHYKYYGTRINNMSLEAWNNLDYPFDDTDQAQY